MRANQIDMKILILPYILIFALILVSLGCKKDNSILENSGKITFNFQSKYTVNNVITTIFEGWVNPKKEDSFEGPKNFYTTFRTKDLTFSKELKTGPYTVMTYYADFDKLFIEKIEVTVGNENKIGFNFNEGLKMNVGKINPFYNVNSDYFTFYFSIPIKEPQFYGIKTQLYLNGKQVFNVNDSGSNVEYRMENFLNGKNEIEAQVIYKDGTKDVKTISFYAFEKNSVNEIWSFSKEDYIKKEDYNYLIFSSKEDVIIDGKKTYKSTIIKGLYGEYDFKYKNNLLESITITHGDMNREPLLTFEKVKSIIDSQFGESIKINGNEYIYKINGYILTLRNQSGVIATSITKQ